jgi:imidazole glycerol-phosphate synthase subunit HisH
MNSSTIGVLNYSTSNSSSVTSCLEAIETEYLIADKFNELTNCKKIIIPGVGNINNFYQKNPLTILRKQILDFVNKGGLIYGICLGMHLFLDKSEEGSSKGLGLISGEVVSLKSHFGMELNVGHKKILLNDNSIITNNLFKGIESNASFYFLHKYFCANISKVCEVSNTLFQNKEIISLFYKDNILATQFHPEISGEAGMKFLRNFTLLNV